MTRKKPAKGAKVLLASLAVSGVLLITNQLAHQAVPTPAPLVATNTSAPVVVAAPSRTATVMPAQSPPPQTAPAPVAAPVPATTTKPSGK